MPLAYMMVGERYGIAPWDIEAADGQRVEYYLNLMAIESEVRSDMHDLDPDEEMYWEDED